MPRRFSYAPSVSFSSFPPNVRLQSVQLLTLGVNNALDPCVKIYDPQLETVCKLQKCDGLSLSRVDAGVFVDDVPRILQEAKSPTVMEALGEALPQNGVNLRWTTGGTLLLKVFLKVGSYLRTHPK